VAQALAEHAGELAGKTVLDVGCGSGVLGLVALALGAARVVAVDVDPESIDVTRENAARNGMTDRIHASTTPIEAVDTVAPVVVANIETRILVPMRNELVRHVAPGGLLLLSGILVPQVSEIHAAYAGGSMTPSCGLEVVSLGPSMASMGEWSLVALRKS
jgi:ribosomal protein L11 methyltransferase